jgi:hypothetical protein
MCNLYSCLLYDTLMWYTRSYNYIHLIDVIGQLTMVHPLVKSSNLNGTSIRREVELHDLRYILDD